MSKAFLLAICVSQVGFIVSQTPEESVLLDTFKITYYD
jgi:hypothetical protein